MTFTVEMFVPLTLRVTLPLVNLLPLLSVTVPVTFLLSPTLPDTPFTVKFTLVPVIVVLIVCAPIVAVTVASLLAL